MKIRKGNSKMSIRIRKVNNILVALCGYETNEKEGDLYLDDGVHYALAAKFCKDWQGRTVDWKYPTEWAEMEKEKIRNAEDSFLY